MEGGGDTCLTIGGEGELVLLTQETMVLWCCGFVGKTKSRFCLAKRLPGEKHCGLTSHLRGKMVVEEDTVFAPGGVVNDRPLAWADLFVLFRAIPENLMSRFEFGVSKPAQYWTDLTMEATAGGFTQDPVDDLEAFLNDVKTQGDQWADMREAPGSLQEGAMLVDKDGEGDTKPPAKAPGILDHL